MLNLIRQRRLHRRFIGGAGKLSAIGVLLGIISVGAAGKERLSTLAPGTLRIGTYFVNPPRVERSGALGRKFSSNEDRREYVYLGFTILK
jgi:hypothetical protein